MKNNQKKAQRFNRKAAVSHSRISCEIEVYTDGDDRRALARGYFAEIAPGEFQVSPFDLREVSGARVLWNNPAPNQPIITAQPITSFDQASDIFRCWAMRTFSENASLHG